MPPRTPPLFGLAPLKSPALPLGLKQGLASRKRKPAAVPPAARAPAPPQAPGRQPKDFLAAAGLLPLPALKRPAARDMRSMQQPTTGQVQQRVQQQQQQSVVQQRQRQSLQQQQHQHQHQQQDGAPATQLGAASRSMGPLGLFLQQTAASAAMPAGRGPHHAPLAGTWQQQRPPKSHASQQQGKERRPSPASSAATVTASELDAGEDSDWSGAESMQPAAAAATQRHNKRQKLVAERRRPPPLQRPAPTGAAAAVMARAEAGAYLPLDM